MKIKNIEETTTYCWWLKSCTTWDEDYPTIHRVLYVFGGFSRQIPEPWTVKASQNGLTYSNNPVALHFPTFPKKTWTSSPPNRCDRREIKMANHRVIQSDRCIQTSDFSSCFSSQPHRVGWIFCAFFLYPYRIHVILHMFNYINGWILGRYTIHGQYLSHRIHGNCTFNYIYIHGKQSTITTLKLDLLCFSIPNVWNI